MKIVKRQLSTVEYHYPVSIVELAFEASNPLLSIGPGR
jgi:hypothetical protein